MRQFILACVLLPGCLLAKQITITITPDSAQGYQLTPTNTKLICASLKANLSSDAIAKLESLKNVPFTCTLSEPTNSPKQLIITLSLSDN